jgi:hypothetical protein
MIRFAPLIVTLALLGCGDSEKTVANSPDKKPMDSVTLDRPTEEETGETTLKDAADRGGFKAFPGQESAVGKKFKRSDGGFKDEVSFEVAESIAKVAEFFKGEGLDTKVVGKQATAMGMTKKNAQLMVVIVEQAPSKVLVTIKSLTY